MCFCGGEDCFIYLICLLKFGVHIRRHLMALMQAASTELLARPSSSGSSAQVDGMFPCV